MLNPRYKRQLEEKKLKEIAQDSTIITRSEVLVNANAVR